jgi:hypothetical protein
MIENLILAFPRLEIYERLFASRSPSLKKILSLVYQDIITFCLDATKLGKRGILKKYALPLINPDR